jgi:hypothetical protein
VSRSFDQLGDGNVLSSTAYESLVCCDQPARIAHATGSLPIAGAVCEACWCTVTSLPGYGPITINRCTGHRS